MKLTKREKILYTICFIILIICILGGGYIDHQFLEAGIIH